MNRRLLFATTNPGKLRELQALGEGLTVLSLADFPGLPEVDEDQETLEGNARKKALTYARLTGVTSLADDSGLCVDALGGRPGVQSARYAPGPDRARIDKLLEELREVSDAHRGASFQCALCLCAPDETLVLEVGRCEGQVLRAPRGSGGFGYDPILFVPSLGKGMAELTLEEKARVSHRGQAFRRIQPTLAAYLGGTWP